MIRRLLAALLLATTPAPAANEITWQLFDYDPARDVDPSVPPADLLIPLPCGGAIALMRIDTDAQADSPLHDQAFRMGAPDIARAPYEYTRRAFIRGAFPGTQSNTTHYFLGRYEVTNAQYDAVTAWAEDKPCPKADPDAGPLPKTDISWFDVQSFGARLSEWARGEAQGLMPTVGGKLGYFRLPSEAEWEFAVRGGKAAPDAAAFNARRFFQDGDLADYGWHEGRTSSQGALQFAGLLLPNPLGLYDVYGNAEEMVEGLYALNAGGRQHGQAGGMTTRGGSYRDKPDEIRSSTRKEYSFYRNEEPAPAGYGHIGFRMALTSFVLSSDQVVFGVTDAWEATLNSDDADPRKLLSDMIENETELKKRSALESVQSELVATLKRADEATSLAMRRALFSGAALIRSMRSIEPRRRVLMASMEAKRADIAAYEADLARPEIAAAQAEAFRDQLGFSIERLGKDETRLAEYDRYLLVDGTNFVNTVDAVYQTSTPESLKREADLLIGDMGRSDQLDMVQPIQRFVEVVEAYRADPAMDRQEMLAFIPD